MKKSSKDFNKNEPMLDAIKINFTSEVDFKKYPFSLDIIKNLKTIEFPTHVTLFVGENGTGKSTILEAIAENVGFGVEGGSKNIKFKTSAEETYLAAESLANSFTLSWRNKPKDGYFFRAESFFNVANYIDLLARNTGADIYDS